jgi:SAM-dependent methyltransferase
MKCVLCDGEAAGYLVVGSSEYHRCRVCELTFIDPRHRPDAASERARYATHRNDPGDAGYRSFLDRLADPLGERLQAGATGLDYGSGPGPTLSVMLEERGHDVALYDPFFADDPAVLLRQYDFITCTEVAEHFFNPRGEFERLARLLRPGGWLGVMTELLHDDIDFATWWYVRDLTHVCFYRPRTMEWIAQRFGWRLEPVGRTVVLFQAGV